MNPTIIALPRDTGALDSTQIGAIGGAALGGVAGYMVGGKYRLLTGAAGAYLGLFLIGGLVSGKSAV